LARFLGQTTPLSSKSTWLKISWFLIIQSFKKSLQLCRFELKLTNFPTLNCTWITSGAIGLLFFLTSTPEIKYCIPMQLWPVKSQLLSSDESLSNWSFKF
jgi:hypothetical protein